MSWDVAFEMKLEISWIVPRIRNEKDINKWDGRIPENIIIPNKPIYRRLAVDEIEVLTKDMNKSYCIEIESWF
jgi:hypothetical protein